MNLNNIWDWVPIKLSSVLLITEEARNKRNTKKKEGPGEFPSEQVRGNTKGRKLEFNKHCIFYFLLLYCLLLVLNPPPKKKNPPIWARCGCLGVVWRVFVWTILAVYFLTLVNWGFAKDMVSYRELFCFKGQKDSCSACSVMSKSLRPITCSRARLLCPLVSPGKNTRVCCHFLLWVIFPIQRLNPHLLHRQAIL